MQIVIAKTAGFCMGVDLALRKLDAALQTPCPGKIYTLGPIIHNPQVLSKYAAQGVNQTDDCRCLKENDTVIIRAHGIPLQTQKFLKSIRINIVDATCPKVKKAQLLIQNQSKSGRHMLLFGERDHPEVRGLVSYAHNSVIFENISELMSIKLDASNPYFLAAQTTQDQEALNNIQDYLQQCIPDIVTLNTICTATRDRQNEVRTLAHDLDAIIVVGGKDSGNTRRLAQIAAECGIYSIHIETSSELPIHQLKSYKRIGLTAGASTPAWIIKSVAEKLTSLDD